MQASHAFSMFRSDVAAVTVELACLQIYVVSCSDLIDSELICEAFIIVIGSDYPFEPPLIRAHSARVKCQNIQRMNMVEI